MLVKREHFVRAALEIGLNGDNDTLPYDIDSGFVRDRSEELSHICFELFQKIEAMEKPWKFIDRLPIISERVLTPSGVHGFRITTKIHPFWNLYLNGLGLAIAEVNEKNRSSRVHSYRVDKQGPAFFEKTKSWRAYKAATIEEDLLNNEKCVVIQTDISSFYEHIYHHRLENIIKDLSGEGSKIAIQIDRILSKLASGRSFGLPVGGQCARVLAEVMMTPIDAALSDAGVVWHRYVDDFTLVCSSQQDAYKSLSILSHSLADYGMSLNRGKTSILGASHYVDFVKAQLGDADDQSYALRELDLHFDPYSDTALTEYENLKKSFREIDVSFLLDLEKEKSQPDSFVLAQIGRALKFQEPKVANQLCATLLNPGNLDSFRASWSKIMRGVYSVRANEDYKDVFDGIDNLLDGVIKECSHLLVPESNILHFMKNIRFRKNDLRSAFVHNLYEISKSDMVKRSCIEVWSHWKDRQKFNYLRNKWYSLSFDEKRTFWYYADRFGDEGKKSMDQLRNSLEEAWRLGFEEKDFKHFAKCYEGWVKNVT